jgi:hypothetical protein
MIPFRPGLLEREPNRGMGDGSTRPTTTSKSEAKELFERAISPEWERKPQKISI